ncbi:hypothetical protein PR202_gb07271 [Eleusine coracana subsp. coracana]|uniref:Uncharacterized protein n=1 Tax=Eleusine coracana subsp. coracana TaxID=191504 RepID=A0AAV5ECK9_ELECO|nr:hypothetical protein PR202_gb07271 [Eleusine coracana subsp. coracana]
MRARFYGLHLQPEPETAGWFKAWGRVEWNGVMGDTGTASGVVWGARGRRTSTRVRATVRVGSSAAGAPRLPSPMRKGGAEGDIFRGTHVPASAGNGQLSVDCVGPGPVTSTRVHPGVSTSVMDRATVGSPDGRTAWA